MSSKMTVSRFICHTSTAEVIFVRAKTTVTFIWNQFMYMKNKDRQPSANHLQLGAIGTVITPWRMILRSIDLLSVTVT